MPPCGRRETTMAKLERIGLQLYTIRDYLADEEGLKAALEKVKSLGYDELHTCGLRGISHETLGRLCREAGLTVVGSHDDFGLMVSDPEKAMANHDLLGTKIMGIGGFFKKTAEDFEGFIAEANKVAAAIKSRGFKFTYHNHSHEFIRLDGGRTAMDMLFEGLDPDNTGFVLDTYWVQHGGGDVRYWIEKLAGRIDILHLKDMAKSIGNETPQYITEVGNGNLWWEGIIDTALRTGVKSFIVEQDANWIGGDPMESIRISSEYLHANFF